MGADIQIINSPKVSHDLAKYLVMGDDAITTFIIWRPEQMISLREKLSIQKWFKNKQSSYFWCKDNQNSQIISYMGFGAIRDRLFLKQRTSIFNAYQGVRFSGSEYNFVREYLKPTFNPDFKCEHHNDSNVYKSGSIYNEFEEITS